MNCNEGYKNLLLKMCYIKLVNKELENIVIKLFKIENILAMRLKHIYIVLLLQIISLIYGFNVEIFFVILMLTLSINIFYFYLD